MVVHRDIKGDNILLHETPDGQFIFKIADFGLSRVIESVDQMLQTVVGAGMYKSP